MRFGHVCLAVLAAIVACRSGGRGCGGAGGDGGGEAAAGSSSGGCSGTIRPPKGACIFLGADGGSALTCVEFTGHEFTPSLVPQVCGVAGMQYAAQGCPTSSLGRCIAQCGRRNEAIHYLYVGTPDGAQRACAGNTPPGYFVP